MWITLTLVGVSDPVNLHVVRDGPLWVVTGARSRHTFLILVLVVLHRTTFRSRVARRHAQRMVHRLMRAPCLRMEVEPLRSRGGEVSIGLLDVASGARFTSSDCCRLQRVRLA